MPSKSDNNPTRENWADPRKAGAYQGSLIAARVREHARVSSVPYNVSTQDARKLACYLGFGWNGWRKVNGKEIDGVRIEIVSGY